MELDLVEKIIANRIMPDYLKKQTGECSVDQNSEDFVKINDVLKSLSSAERIKDNFAFRPLFSHRKIIGKMIVFVKRIIRKMLKWYVEPICFQQSDYNNHIVKALYDSIEIMKDLIEKNNSLSNEITILNEKIKKLEEKM